MVRLLLTFVLFAMSLAHAKDFPIDYMNEWQSKNIDLQNSEWLVSHPSPNRTFLVHSKLKVFALITEHISTVPVEKMEEYFAGPFTTEALLNREAFLRKEEGVIDLQGGSDTHVGVRYGGTSFKVAMDEGVARFYERMWSEPGKLWHLSLVSFETASEEMYGDMNFLMEKISKAPVKTTSFFNVLIPEAFAYPSSNAVDARCKINESGEWKKLSGIIPRVKKESKCNDVNIAAANRGNGYGIKLDLSSLSGCTQGPAAAWNSMKQSFLSGLNSLAQATEQKIKQYGCESLKPPKAKGFWDSIGNSFAMQSYTDCLSAAATGAVVSQAWQGIKATLGGIRDLYNWVKAGNNPWSAAVAMVSKSVNGFLCLNAAAQAKVVCEYATHFFIAMGVVVATAATGGALAPVAGAGTAARVAMAVERGMAAARAFIATPYTVTKTIVKAPARIVERVAEVGAKRAERRAALTVTSVGSSAGKARPKLSVRATPRTEPIIRKPASVTPKPKPRPTTAAIVTETEEAGTAELNRQSLRTSRQQSFNEQLSSKGIDPVIAEKRIKEIGIEDYLSENAELMTSADRTRLTELYKDINPNAPPPALTVASNAAVKSPDDVFGIVIGEKYSLEDKQSVLDILSNRLKTQADRDKYFKDHSDIPGYQKRFEELEAKIKADPNREKYAQVIDEYGSTRVAKGNDLTKTQADDLAARKVAKASDVDCNKLNRLYPGSFPSENGLCKKIKFDEDLKGEYCACGNMGKNTFNFLSKCPSTSKGYSTLNGIVDDLALPVTSLPHMCSRVDIPKDKECYMGSTSVAFAGFGGAVQLMCLNKASDRWKSDPEIAKWLNDGELQAGGPQISPSRWSPFSTFPGFQKVVELAARNCPETCSADVLADLKGKFELEMKRIRETVTDPKVLQRLDMEKEAFASYFEDLQVGRRSYPAQARTNAPDFVPVKASPIPDESDRFATLRRAGKLNDSERVSEASSLLDRPLTDAQKEAIIKAHNIGSENGHGYFTYTSQEIARKGIELKKAGFTAPEIRTLMEKGITGSEAVLDRYDGIRASGLATKAVDQLQMAKGDPTKVTELMKTYREQNQVAAQSFASEARTKLAGGDKAYSLVNTGLSIEKYIQAGDVNGAMAMVNSGLGQGMTKEGIIKSLSQRLNLDPNSSRPDILLQRKTFAQVKEQLSPKPVVTPKPVVVETKPQPKPEVKPEVKPEPVAEPVRTPAVAKVVSPREASNLANDYRLGQNGKVKSPELASQYYMQAAEENFKKEMVRKRGYNEGSNYLGDRNIHGALTESLSGDGTVALKMVDRLATETKGGHGLNEFISEMHELNAYSYKNNPQARANMMKIIKSIEENYKDKLYSPQQSMMRAWRSANDW